MMTLVELQTWRRWVVACTLEKVCAIQGCRVDLDQNLTCLQLWNWDVLILQDVGATTFRKRNAFHGRACHACDADAAACKKGYLEGWSHCQLNIDRV